MSRLSRAPFWWGLLGCFGGGAACQQLLDLDGDLTIVDGGAGCATPPCAVQVDGPLRGADAPQPDAAAMDGGRDAGRAGADGGAAAPDAASPLDASSGPPPDSGHALPTEDGHDAGVPLADDDAADDDAADDDGPLSCEALGAACSEDGCELSCAGFCLAGECVQCPPGVAECLPGLDERRACGADGFWSAPEACEASCLAGDCVECEPFSTACVAGGGRATCSANGAWEAATSCPELCVGGECAACQPGSFQCSADGGLVECDQTGAWGTPLPCAGACLLGQCVACQPLTARCEDGKLLTCTDVGEWGAPTACSDHCLAGVCVDCEPGAAKCSQNRLSVCDSAGAWSPPVACEGQLCDATLGRCTGECTPGDQRCLSAQSAETCDDEGHWGPETTCPNGACVNDRCAGCLPGQRLCVSETSYLQCDDTGAWPGATGALDCEEACIDRAPAAAVCGCNPSATRCDPAAAAVPQECDEQGEWVSGPSCELGCIDGECAQCTSGATRCDPQTPAVVQLCVAGRWQGQPACEALCRQGNCVECDVNDVRCFEQVPQRCGGDGAWLSLGPACETPVYQCNTTSSSASCFDNPLREVGNTDLNDEVPTDLRNDRLFAFPVELTAPAVVYAIGVLAAAQAAGDDPEVALALYDSAGAAPGARLAQGSATLMLTAGDRESPLAEPLMIPAGRYWITYLASTYGRLFASAQTNVDYYYQAHSFGDALPDTLAQATRAAGARFGVYLEVRYLPE